MSEAPAASHVQVGSPGWARRVPAAWLTGLALAGATAASLAQPLPLPASNAAALPVRQLAATCASCHGTDGRPADAAMPALAGLPASFLIAQMRAFRTGERPATVMHQITRGYTEAQVEALAAYFAELPR